MNVQNNIDLMTEAYLTRQFVYFDLETIPCQDEDYLLELERKVQAPKNLKKQESIDKWLSENRKSAAKEKMGKTSFDGGRGHICTIAWAKNDSPIAVRHAKTVEEEAEVIKAFFADLDPYHNEMLVGHNIAGFDIGFLRKRAVVLGIKMPDASSLPRDPKPWDKNIHDTMSMWAGGTAMISMDNLCNILGIQGKDGFDGSMVAAAWARGEHDKISEYCKDDVWKTRKIHQKLLQAGW